MPFIVDCPEWGILEKLKHRVQYHKQRFSIQQNGSYTQVLVSDELDATLRRVLLIHSDTDNREITLAEFTECKTILAALCALLDQLVHPILCPNSNEQQDSVYPRLEALTKALRESHETFDLVTGGKQPQALFKVPDDQDVALKAVSLIAKYNESLTELLSLVDERNLKRGPPVPVQEEKRNKKKRRKLWKDCSRRVRADSLLGLLFSELRSRCPRHVSHKVMLKLSRFLDDGMDVTDLDLLVSSCPDPSRWEHVQCVSCRFETMSIINNLCTSVQENGSRGKTLRLTVAQFMLYGEWCISHPDRTGSDHLTNEETLDQLIAKGAFGPPSWSIEAGENRQLSIAFNGCERRSLALRLGYHLLDFFDMKLSSEKVYLLGRTGSSLTNATPFVSFSSDIPGLAADGDTGEGRGIPSLLAFAELLLEMEIGSKRPSKLETESDIWADLNKTTMTLEKRDNNNSDIKAIRGCLKVYQEMSRASWIHSGPAPVGDSSSATKRIRKMIYEEVVYNLEKSLKASIPETKRKRGRDEESLHQSASDNIDRLSVAPVPKRRIISPTRQVGLHSTVKPMEELAGGLFDDTSPVDHALPLCQSADNFIQKHMDLYSQAFDLDDIVLQNLDRIKVAVLDTGLDIYHNSIQVVMERIKGKRTWLPNRSATDVRDLSGHGTHITNLLLEMIPDSDIYIAQIADQRPLSAYVIAEAIRHAVREWKVDMITMSFGFEKETATGCDDLTDAILEAHRSRVLMFAAASNNGAYGLHPAFPAKHSSVFCIYSGDGMGNSAATNPNHRANNHNFLALGEAVESAWPVALSAFPHKKRKSGTSFAAPVAAGMAACLMQDARLILDTEEARRFNEYDKMKDLLSNVSTARQNYHVISLRAYFDEPVESRRQILRKCLYGGL